MAATLRRLFQAYGKSALPRSLAAAALSSLLLTACAGASGGFPPVFSQDSYEAAFEAPAPDEEAIRRSERAYYDLLERHTQRGRPYRDRFDTPVAYWASYLSWPLQLAETRALARRLLWGEPKWNEALAKARERWGEKIIFRVDIYTERLDENRIGVGKNFPWNAYLVLPGGERIEPTRVIERTGAESEKLWLYPPHNRFSKLYEIEFARPPEPFADGAPARLEITGHEATSATEWFLGRDGEGGN